MSNEFIGFASMADARRVIDAAYLAEHMNESQQERNLPHDGVNSPPIILVKITDLDSQPEYEQGHDGDSDYIIGYKNRYLVKPLTAGYSYALGGYTNEQDPEADVPDVRVPAFPLDPAVDADTEDDDGNLVSNPLPVGDTPWAAVLVTDDEYGRPVFALICHGTTPSTEFDLEVGELDGTPLVKHVKKVLFDSSVGSYLNVVDNHDGSVTIYWDGTAASAGMSLGNTDTAASTDVTTHASTKMKALNPKGIIIHKGETSGDYDTIEGIDADVAQAGIISTDAQSMSGDKEFIDRFRFGLNYVSDGPRVNSPHEGHDGIGEAFSLGWPGGSADRYANFFKGGVMADGDKPGVLKVWDRIHAVLRYICNGKDGLTEALPAGYLPTFEGGIYVDKTAINAPEILAGKTSEDSGTSTTWSPLDAGGSSGLSTANYYHICFTIPMTITCNTPEIGGGNYVQVFGRIAESTDGGTTWTGITDTEISLAYCDTNHSINPTHGLSWILKASGTLANYRYRLEIKTSDPSPTPFSVIIRKLLHVHHEIR